ncbi:MAG: biosynthetic-type acetolactate synthase large subunit [SAR202 cluster bacterium]|nr:biosynthetic-type acetolactate synthase large subunit [SAR202 cluster bacterium]MQG35232.1 biosynthetic-type acetolactate synthase large subunit [SAR202 cluster bacterium]|tara:strand:- start:41917 stop:43608 length:1692 start_codon:yes stop_codon:yes gene_type:complete
MKLTGAEIVCESLIEEGVDVLFGLPGGAILPFYGALPKYSELKHILVRHEQAAAMAADGYARSTGKVGVCTATSGPGATNLVTGITAAQMDSVPIVAITGQVSRPAIGKDAFQETDVTGITLPVTKHNYLVMNTEEIATAIKEAFHIARTGRPGPVLVDIPRDVLTETCEYIYPVNIDLPGYKPKMEASKEEINEAVQLINDAKKPVIIAGHGALISHAHNEVIELAEKCQIPVITTLLGISTLPTDHFLNLGMPGMHGMAYASIAIEESDTLIALGMRFDDRVTGKLEAFAPNARVLHVDIDPSELGKNIKPHVGIQGDLKTVLNQLIPAVDNNINVDWMNRIEQLRSEHPSLNIRETSELLPQYVLKELAKETNQEAIIVTGVGQHQMWAAQFCEFSYPNSWVTSGGLGTMGFEVPAALGAKVGQPDKAVWSIAGDGGFQMTFPELATAVENNIDVKFAILNNNNLGMVKQLQDLSYDSEYTATQYAGNPDFVKIAEAYGITGIRVTDKTEVSSAIQTAINTPGPVIVEFIVRQEENVYPFIPSGQTVNDMIEEPQPEIKV